MNTHKDMEKKETRFLPHDLLIQILLKLSVMSLLRFKCVCKSWFSLISDPLFANSHFQTQTPRILSMTSKPDSKKLSIDCEAPLSYDTACRIPNPNFMHPESNFNVQIINSCRGFIFLHLDTSLRIWNPSTGVCRQIPLSPYHFHGGSGNYFYLHGFGYDPLRDDYLVISVSYNHRLHIDDIYSCFEFFSLRDNTWKEIEGTEFNMIENSTKCFHPKAGSLFNVAIHWIAFDDEISTHIVIAFDLVERKLVQIPFPEEFFDDEIQLLNFDVWVFGEFLSLWSVDYGGEVEIWVLKEYNVHSSWTKALVLSLDHIPFRLFSPIYSTKSGDIVAKYDDGLLKYNNEGQLLERELFLDGPFQSGSDFQATVYTESLFSLPVVNVQAEEDDTNKKNELKRKRLKTRQSKKSKTSQSKRLQTARCRVINWHC